MTVAAYRDPATGVVYYLQRTDARDRYEIRRSPGKRRPLIVKSVESKSEWREFVAGL